MRLNIGSLTSESGQRTLDFSGTLDLSALTLWGQKPFTEPVKVEGQVKERSGILTLCYTADYTLNIPCARCLRPVDHPQKPSFTHTLVQEVQNEENDTLVLVPDGSLNLEELVGADLVLGLEPVVLCKEDCKGLCPKCGGDRNVYDCGCGTEAE